MNAFPRRMPFSRVGGGLVLVLSIATVEVTAQTQWTKVRPAGLQPLHRAAMAFDAVRGRMVLYGGGNPSFRSDETWEWNGTGWTQLFPATDPGPLQNHAMAFDEARNRVVLFGGYGASGSSGETWEWDGSGWTQRFPATSPSPRHDHAMVYDAARGRVVLFGGRNGGELGDTWSYDGATWTRLAPAVSPAPRHFHAMAYDAARARVVLFGGADGGVRNDTWELDGDTWTQMFPTTAPPAGENGAMSFFPGLDRVVYFGGETASEQRDQTWQWDGTAWTDVSAPARPAAREGPAIGYDPLRRQVVLFGGRGIGTFSDTWEWNGARWNERWAGSRPTARVDHAMAYDEARGQVVLFGGGPPGVSSNETWLWDGVRWTRAEPANKPPPRRRAALAYDAARQRVLLFGGIEQGFPEPRDTWEWDGTNWTERFPTYLPVRRSEHAMAYDRARQQVVMFGGLNTQLFDLGDTVVWNGDDWTHIRFPANNPRERQEHAMAYHGRRRTVVLFGGKNPWGLGTFGDTWEWNGSNWLSRTGGSNAPSIANTAMVYDASRDRIVITGGTRSVPFVGEMAVDETWEWDGVSWAQRQAFLGLPITAHAMAYDQARRHTVLFGGGTQTQPGALVPLDDTWEYAATNPADYTSFGQGCPGSAGTPTLQRGLGQLPWTGETFDVQLSNLATGQPAWLLVGASRTQWGAVPLPFGLGVVGMPSCTLYASGEVVLPLANAGGSAVATFPIPAAGGIVGQQIFVQGFAGDPGVNALGLTVSDAGEITFGSR